MSGLEGPAAQLSLWNSAMSPCSLCAELPVAQGGGQSDGDPRLSETLLLRVCLLLVLCVSLVTHRCSPYICKGEDDLILVLETHYLEFTQEKG